MRCRWSSEKNGWRRGMRTFYSGLLDSSDSRRFSPSLGGNTLGGNTRFGLGARSNPDAVFLPPHGDISFRAGLGRSVAQEQWMVLKVRGVFQAQKEESAQHHNATFGCDCLARIGDRLLAKATVVSTR